MSTQITTAFVNEYRANIELLLQQKGSRLRPTVRNESQAAEFDFYDRIGAVSATERTGRHTDTPLSNTPHDRRRVALRDFEWADLVDQTDKIRLITDPEEAYVRNAVAALGRSQDEVILEAAFGTAVTGKTGSGSQAFPGGQQVAVDYVESGSSANSGLTIGKLRRAKQLLDAAETDPDDPRSIVVTAKQINDLLQTTEVTSQDFAAVRALVTGELNMFMGFTFVRTELVETDTNDYRRVPVYARSGIILASGMEINAKVDLRVDKSYSVQVFASGTYGSTRMEEKKVVEIKCDET